MDGKQIPASVLMSINAKLREDIVKASNLLNQVSLRCNKLEQDQYMYIHYIRIKENL